MSGAPYAHIRAIVDQCYFSIHLSATWTGNHRTASVIFSYNPRISPAPRARTGVTRSYLVYALLLDIIVKVLLRVELYVAVCTRMRYCARVKSVHIEYERERSFHWFIVLVCFLFKLVLTLFVGLLRFLLVVPSNTWEERG